MQTNENVPPQDDQRSNDNADRRPDLRPAEERYAEFIENYQDSSDFSDESLDAAPTFGINMLSRTQFSGHLV